MMREKILRFIAKILRVDLPKEYIDPVDKIFELKDDIDTCYVWKTKEDVNSTQLNNIIYELNSRFIRNNGREPQSLHIIMNGIEDINKMSSEELEKVVLPWAKKKSQKNINS